MASGSPSLSWDSFGTAFPASEFPSGISRWDACPPHISMYYSSDEEEEVAEPTVKRLCTVPPAPQLSKDRDYFSVKQRFELTHFKCKSVFFSRGEAGKWECYGKINFTTKEEHVQYDTEVFDKRSKEWKTVTKCFVQTWYRDDHIRQYELVQCLPPPLPVPAGAFNTWTGFTNEHKPPATGEERVKYYDQMVRILDHILVIAGDDPNVQKYLIYWIASIVQRPGIKTRILNIIKSVVKGSGKGTFKDIIWAIIGKEYCFHTEDPQKQLFSGFNNSFRDKLFVSLDESNQQNLSGMVEALKSIVTESTQNLRAMYKENDESVPSFVNVCILTNRDIAWEHKDRRPLYLDVADRLAPSVSGTNHHFKEVYESLADDRFCKVLFDYFKDVDLTGVDLEQQRPVTELHKAMEARSCPVDLQFFVHFGWNERYFLDSDGREKKEFKAMGSDLHKMYMLFISEHKDFKPMNSVQFGLKMKDRIREGMKGVEKARTNKGVAYVFRIKEFKEWLTQNNFYTEETNSILIDCDVQGIYSYLSH